MPPVDPTEQLATLAETSPASSGRRLPRVLAPFRHPAYRRLAAAMVAATFASGVWVVALVWEVVRIGGGPTQLSMVTTANAVGVLIPALLGGVVADRVPQKLILICVASVELAGMALVALLSWTDATQLWHLMAVSLATGLGMAFYYPAYSAWLPALVPEDDLMAVNGFEGMVRPTIGQALGPAVAGAAVGAATSASALAIAAAASLCGLLALLLVPLTPVRRELAESSGRGALYTVATAWADVREGFTYMVRTSWLLASLAFASVMVMMVMGPMQVLMPFVIKDGVGGGAGGHATVLAAFGIGGALGSLAMGQLRMPRRYLTVMNLMWGLACLPFLVVGHADALWHLVVATFLVGIGFSAPMVIWGTLLQRRVPAHLLGRVASLDFFVSISLVPLSMALAGPLAATVGMTATFTVVAVVPLLAAAVAIVVARLPADEIAHPLR